MSIVPIKHDTPIAPGQFLCASVSDRGALCGYPREITKVSGSRIYYIREKGGPVRHMTRDGGFVCDTVEEGVALAELGFKRARAIEAAQLQARRDVMAQFADEIAQITGPGADSKPPAAPGL